MATTEMEVTVTSYDSYSNWTSTIEPVSNVTRTGCGVHDFYQEDLETCWMWMSIRNWILIIIVIVGTIGNGLSICVLVRPRMRNISIYFYLLMLAITDIICLWLMPLRNWIASMFGYYILRESPASCLIFTFLQYVVQHLSCWFIVLMTVDRFVAVWLPLHLATWCSIERARIFTCVTVTAAVWINLHIFYTFQLTETGRCMKKRNIPFMGDSFEHFHNSTWLYIPFILVFGLNIVIIAALIRHAKRNSHPESRRHAGGYGSSSSQSSGVTATQKKVIYLLLVVSFTWLALSLPRTILPVNTALHTTSAGRVMVFVSLHMNHAINFFLYCLTGKKFRKELKSFLTGGVIVEYVRKFSLKQASQPTARTEYPNEPMMALNAIHTSDTEPSLDKSSSSSKREHNNRPINYLADQ